MGKVENNIIKESPNNLEELKRQKQYGIFLQNNLIAGKILKKNGYKIFNINEANQDFRKIMKLDDIQSFDASYVKDSKGKQVDKNITISKQNFWNAFYGPIWNNLDLQKKLLSVEWLFNEINQKNGLQMKGITYLPEDIALRNMNGYSAPNNPYIFFSIDSNLFVSGSQLNSVGVIAHELEHKKQELYIKKYQNQNVNDLFSQYLKAKYIEDGVLPEIFLFLSNDKRKIAYYKCLPDEKDARFQECKTLLKYRALNTKQFGADKKADRLLNNYIKALMFKGVVDVKAEDGKVHRKYEMGTISSEREIFEGKVDIPIKIYILQSKNYCKIYEIQTIIDSKNTEMQHLEMQQSDAKNISGIFTLKSELKNLKNQLNQYSDKAKNYSNAFAHFMKNNDLPSNFDATELDLLGITNDKSITPRYLKPFDKQENAKQDSTSEQNIDEKNV